MGDEIENIGAVLSYSTAGHSRACGQTVGGNGSGDYSVIFMGNPDDAEEKARQYIRDIERSGYRITQTIITANNDGLGFGRNPVAINPPSKQQG